LKPPDAFIANQQQQQQQQQQPMIIVTIDERCVEGSIRELIVF
jgi:hypothetical protein